MLLKMLTGIAGERGAYVKDDTASFSRRDALRLIAKGYAQKVKDEPGDDDEENDPRAESLRKADLAREAERAVARQAPENRGGQPQPAGGVVEPIGKRR
jgi:hypothetical protein